MFLRTWWRSNEMQRNKETLLPKIIVNADDFGRDAVTNKRIIDCFERGLISSATVMTNMPGFDEVVQWWKSQEKKPKLGIHLNLDEGEPASGEFRAAYPNSYLFYSGSVTSCDRRYLQIIRQELKAQIERLLSAGIRPTHFDSHHHLHAHWQIAQVVVSLAEEYGVRNIRMAGNVLFPSALPKRLYRHLLNRFLFQRRLQGEVKLFSYLDRFMKVRPDVGGEIIELMIHPGVDTDYTMLLGDEYAEFIRYYELVSYPDN